jgi:UPF0755 protein
MTLCWIGFSYQKFLTTPINIEQPRVFDVQPGTGAFAVAAKLSQDSIAQPEEFIKLFLWLNPDFHAIKSGRYQLQPGWTVADLFQHLVNGKQLEYSLTLVEGQTFRQIRKTLAENPYLTRHTPSLTDQEILQRIGAQYSHPEGLFFADTYQFPNGYSDLELLRRAHKRLLQVLNEEWNNRENDLPYDTPYEALIMASIVEKETAIAEERPRIAGVFVRRLQKNMRLQTDPTVIYGIGEAYDGDIKRIHLKTDTPYNTYTRKGLPPTPIATVGREAIHAALHPTKESALYFVAKGDGSHQFSDTLEQHLAAVRKYQLKK